MSTIPTSKQATTDPTETLEQKFQRLASARLDGTAYLSSSTEMVAHPAFQGIVAMGPPVIALRLRELEKRTGHWHRALHQITGANPVQPSGRGNIARMCEAWLRWRREKGYHRVSP